MLVLGISETFSGPVVVAIAGNAIENIVGIQLAWRNQSDYAMSVILNSSLQVAIGLIPVLVLLSFVLGGPILTLVRPSLLIVALALTSVVTAFVVYDGESIWFEGYADRAVLHHCRRLLVGLSEAGGGNGTGRRR